MRLYEDAFERIWKIDTGVVWNSLKILVLVAAVAEDPVRETAALPVHTALETVLEAVTLVLAPTSMALIMEMAAEADLKDLVIEFLTMLVVIGITNHMSSKFVIPEGDMKEVVKESETLISE